MLYHFVSKFLSLKEGKPATLVVGGFTTYICDGVNQVGLPPYAVELILESLLRDVQNIRKSAIQEEMEAAKKAAAEKAAETPVDAAEDKPEESVK